MPPRVETGKSPLIGRPLKPRSLSVAATDPDRAAITIVASGKAVDAPARCYRTGHIVGRVVRLVGAPRFEQTSRVGMHGI